MKSKNKTLKIIVSFVYLLILLTYLFFLFGKYLPSEYDADLKLFGKYFYVLDNGQLVSVDYSKIPEKNDDVFCTINEKKYIAKVIDQKSNGEMSLKIEIDGNTKYYTVKNIKGVAKGQIPYLGYIYNFFHSIYALILIVFLPCLFIIMYEIIKIVLMFKNRNKDERYDDDYILPKNMTQPQNNNNFFNLNKDKMTNIENDIETKNINDNSIFDTYIKDQNINNTNSSKDFKNFNEINSNTIYDMKYKMDFQDTHEIKNKYNEFIESDNDQLNILKKYGVEPSKIDNGVSIKIEPHTIKHLELKLRNDGTLEINTDNYNANIDIEF